MFIDTHCHLNFPQFDPDRAMVIGNARKAGVKKFINPGVDLFFSKQAVLLAQKHPGVVFAGIGFHPYEAQHNIDVSDLEKILLESTKQQNNEASPIVAIGECGLDYHEYKGEKAEGKKGNQKRMFEDQLHLALKYNLPVIFHCRDAYDDFFDVIDGLPTLPKGVIHCFSGGLQEIRMARERNFYVGIDGNVTYSKQLQMVVPNIPFSMLLLETDAPYLTPVPHRGTRNEPKYIPAIAKEIAELLHCSLRDVESATTKNTIELFHLS